MSTDRIVKRMRSLHPRGYWTDEDERPGVTKLDPPRYRRFSMPEMVHRGWVNPLLSTDYDTVKDELHLEAQTLKNIEDQRLMGANAPTSGRPEMVVTRHTVLGRLRNYKQWAYEDGIRRLLDTLDLDVAESWDHLDVDAEVQDGSLVVWNRKTGDLVVALDRVDTAKIDAAAREYDIEDRIQFDEDLRAAILDAEAAADQAVDALDSDDFPF
uniref:Uncharacterized protein n=1 Tax=viral metagenome TaxID=1070528 RepID=A0A6M3JRW5_9ZZZZ